MHHHTENESSLFSCLVLSSSVFSSLSVPVFFLSLSLSLCLSLSLSPCGVVCDAVLCFVVVMCCVVVLCVVCDTLKTPVCPLNTSPCVRSKRPRVYWHHAHTCFNMCARAAGTNGDVLNVHTETFFIGKTSDFDISWASLTDVGFISYRQFSAYHEWPTYGLSRASEVHQRNPWEFTHLKFENRSITAHSRFLQSSALPEHAVGLQ